MPHINEGLVVDGAQDVSDPNSEAGFQAMLAEKVAAGRESVDEDRPDPEEIIHAPAPVVRGQLLEGGDSIGNSISEGLEYGDRRQRAERQSLSPENAALVSEASERIEAMEGELADHRKRELEAEAWGVLEDFYDPDKDVDAVQRIEAWAGLDARAKLEAINEGVVDVEDAKQLEAAAEAMLGIGTVEMATEQLASEYEAAYNAKVRALESWAQENGLTKSQAQERFADAIAAARASGIGHVFDARAVNVSPAEFENYLRVVDSLAVEARSHERQAAFKEDILSQGADVSSGLTSMGVPMNPPLAPTPQELERQARDRNDRILSRATRRVMTGAQFKDELRKPDLRAEIDRAYSESGAARAFQEHEENIRKAIFDRL